MIYVTSLLNPNVTCEICNFATNNVEKLRKHYDDEHENTESVLTCNDYEFEADAEENVKDHMNLHKKTELSV